MDEESRLNPRLTKTEDQFVEIMNNLNLDYPKQIGRSIIQTASFGNVVSVYSQLKDF